MGRCGCSSAPLYLALGVCVVLACCTVGCMLVVALYIIKQAESLFLVKERQEGVK